MAQVGFGDADATVFHCEMWATDSDGDGIAAVGILHCVAHQIVYGYAQQLPVCHYAEVVSHLKPHAVPAFRPHDLRKAYALHRRPVDAAAARMRELQQFAHDVHYAVRLLRYALQYIAVFVWCAICHQRHLAFALYGGERIVYLVRCVVHEHLLSLIVAVDAVEHAQCVQAADEIEHSGREHHEHEQPQEQHAVDVVDERVAAQHNHGEGARVVVVDECRAHFLPLLEVYCLVGVQPFYLVAVEIALQLFPRCGTVGKVDEEFPGCGYGVLPAYHHIAVFHGVEFVFREFLFCQGMRLLFEIAEVYVLRVVRRSEKEYECRDDDQSDRYPRIEQ